MAACVQGEIITMRMSDYDDNKRLSKHDHMCALWLLLSALPKGESATYHIRINLCIPTEDCTKRKL